MTAVPARRRTARGIDAEVLIESPRWRDVPQAEDIVCRAVAAAAAQTRIGGEVSLVLTDDAAIRALNRTWRGKDAPTNVLSFPAPGAEAGTQPPSMPRMLGDIVIAYETVRREAAAERKPFEHHLAHLAVHGFLHLLGYDHETESEAESMERLERRILKGLGVSDPYAARDSEA